MRKWIMMVFGMSEMIAEQKKTNELLTSILKESKRNSDLVEAYNKWLYIK